MTIFRSRRSLAILLVVGINFYCSPDSHIYADILISLNPDVETGLVLRRLDDAGNRKQRYNAPPEFEFWWANDFSFDRETNQIFVQAFNEVRDAVYRLDAATGSFLGGFEMPHSDGGEVHGTMYFSLSRQSEWPNVQYNLDIRDTITGSVVSSSPVPHAFGSQYVRSIQFQPADIPSPDLATDYYFIGGDGIYTGSFSDSGHSVTKIADLVAGTFQQQILLGPDGFLYVGEYHRAIRRYSVTGDFQEVVLDAPSLGMLMDEFEFGPNGDLYVVGHDQDFDQYWLKRFAGTNGPEISSTEIPSAGIDEFARFAILVPEPTAFALSVASLAGICLMRATRCRC